MRKYIRHIVFVGALLAVAAVAYAAPVEGYEITYYDQYGNVVGKEALYCNGVRFQWGQITTNYDAETWSCSSGGP
ncbi:MAG: DUF6289 family protein [Pseudoxanthomonas sp.]